MWDAKIEATEGRCRGRCDDGREDKKIIEDGYNESKRIEHLRRTAVTAGAAMGTTTTAYDGGADNSSKWQQWKTAQIMGEHERRGRGNLKQLSIDDGWQ